MEGVDSMTDTPKRGRGRPPKEIEKLPATAEEIRDALIRAAERKREGNAGEQPA